MVEAPDVDRAVAVLVVLVAEEVGLGPRIEPAAVHRVGVPHHVEIAADRHVLHAGQPGHVIDVVEHVFDRHRLAVADHEPNHRDPHHAAARRHLPDRLVGLAAQVPRDQRARGRVGEDHRFGRRVQRVERGLVAAVRDIHGHADLLHPLHDRQAEDRQAAVALLEEAAADAVVEVVGELRDPLSQPEERPHIVGRPEVRRVLEGEHDADLLLRLGADEVGGVVDPRQPVAVAGEEAVPAREEVHGILETAGAGAERERGDAGRLIARRVLGGEPARLGQPLLDLRRPDREIGELELVQEIDDDRRLDQPDGAGRVLRVRLREQRVAPAQHRRRGQSERQRAHRLPPRHRAHRAAPAWVWTMPPPVMTDRGGVSDRDAARGVPRARWSSAWCRIR